MSRMSDHGVVGLAELVVDLHRDLKLPRVIFVEWC